MLRRFCLSALVISLVVAGCSDDDDVDAGGDGASSDLTWEALDCPDDVPEGEVCAKDTEIATVEVPIDYDNPDGETLELAVARRRAEKPRERIGVLYVNPGGPGGSAVDTVMFLDPDPKIRERFDIVGFDPRGVGRSEPLDCGVTAAELVGVDQIVDTPEEAQQLIDSAQRLADACSSAHPELVAHMGTRDAARDMDHLRGVLGEETISYLGYSYGTAIGQVYAAMFPDRLRAMVLDGVDDISRSGTDANLASAVASEQALRRFADWCAQRAECPLKPDPMKVVDQVQAATQAAPIPAPDANRPLGPGELNWAALLPLYASDLWPQFADALAAANTGDGTKLVELLDEILADADLAVAFAVDCLDKPVARGDTQAVLDAAKAAGAQAPHYGEAYVNRSLICATWRTDPQPLTPLDLTQTPQVVVVSTVNDPSTPYQAGVDLARQLPHGTLVTYQGDGHTIYGQHNDCVDQAVDRYLLDPTKPNEDTTCS